MRGEVAFDALGQRWTLFIGSAAQCALEEEHDRGFVAIVQDSIPTVAPEDIDDKAKMMIAARSVRLTTLRSFAYHGLAKHHRTVTLDQVDDIIDELGNEAFGQLIGQAIAGAIDRVAGTEPGRGGGPARPGKRSTRRPARTGTP